MTPDGKLNGTICICGHPFGAGSEQHLREHATKDEGAARATHEELFFGAGVVCVFLAAFLYFPGRYFRAAFPFFPARNKTGLSK